MPSSEDYDRPLNPELNVEFKLNSETLDKINEDPDAFISAINAAFSNIRKFGVGKSTTLGVPYESGTEQYMNLKFTKAEKNNEADSGYVPERDGPYECCKL